MTDNEIIKALECCGNQMYVCTDKQCRAKTSGNAVDLIKSQKAEIEQWKAEANRWQNAFCKAHDDIVTAKIESIKEFAKRLIDAFPEGNRGCKCPAIYFDDYCYIIDELCEEMVGEEE